MKLGVLGGGQLAQMLTLAAYPLAIRTVCLDPNPLACSSDLTLVLQGDFSDQAVLDNFLKTVDVVTFETENIPLDCAKYVQQKKPLFPSLNALEVTQDRLHEKHFFQSMGVPTADFFPISTEEDLENAALKTGFPAILKTRRLGYDGKGQSVIQNHKELKEAFSNGKSHSLILEGFVSFDYEVSLIAVRSHEGHILFYPLIRNHHKSGILHHSEAPFFHNSLQNRAEAYATKILNEWNYVGVLTIEFFVSNNHLIANEMAPRVHNSGHWTLEGAHTSQFENHVRAVCGLPLGSTETIGQSFMLNLVGNVWTPQSGPQLPGLHYHLYGKEPRANRKLGHVTLVDMDFNRFKNSRDILIHRDSD
jgi:5-(carboxyamino)imidazole ribonucleotide synthase